MTEEQKGELVRTAEGKFVKGVSGNPAGRPKGSKNKITLLKMQAEEALREDNHETMLKVAQLIVAQALEGDRASQKLVWDALVSKGGASDEKDAKSQQRIQVNTMNVHGEPGQRVIDAEFTTETDSEQD